MNYYQTDANWENMPLGNNSTIGATGCAFTCACMCVKKTPKVVHMASSAHRTEECDWNAIATFYGKTYENTSNKSYKEMVALLKAGKPAIVRVAPTSSQHWVVVYAFDGVDASPTSANFTCFDPYTHQGHVKLDQALRFNSSGCPYNVLSIY